MIWCNIASSVCRIFVLWSNYDELKNIFSLICRHVWLSRETYSGFSADNHGDASSHRPSKETVGAGLQVWTFPLTELSILRGQHWLWDKVCVYVCRFCKPRFMIDFKIYHVSLWVDYMNLGVQRAWKNKRQQLSDSTWDVQTLFFIHIVESCLKASCVFKIIKQNGNMMLNFFKFLNSFIFL